MAAKLQAMGYEAYFYEPAAGGHGYGKDNKERAAFVALGYAFLRERIGWPDGDDRARQGDNEVACLDREYAAR